MRLFVLSFLCFLVAGCSATVKGVKEDTKNAYEWSKQKVNEAATAIKEKTE